jgi:hypothetical protein
MKRRVKIILSIIGILLVIFTPLPNNKKIIDNAVNTTLDKMHSGGTIIFSWQGNWKIHSFPDSIHINKKKAIYYSNDTEISISTFTSRGYIPISEYIKPKIHTLDSPYGYLNVTHINPHNEKKSENIYLSIVHGSLGAQCYRLHIYNTIFFTYTFYTIEWVS